MRREGKRVSCQLRCADLSRRFSRAGSRPDAKGARGCRSINQRVDRLYTRARSGMRNVDAVRRGHASTRIGLSVATADDGGLRRAASWSSRADTALATPASIVGETAIQAFVAGKLADVDESARVARLRPRGAQCAAVTETRQRDAN